jgi:EmrB/QacA subfamily drug resistance transporter
MGKRVGAEKEIGARKQAKTNPTAADDRDSRRWWVLAAVTLAVLAAGVDSTVLSVALPTLAVKLHASQSDLEWFSTGYLLTLAAAMLPVGVLGDRYGRKKLLLGGLALFGLGSLGCAFSVSAWEFLVARLFIGAAGSAVIVMAITAITVVFSEQDRPKAVSIWAVANAVALPIGPILGGWMLSRFWWGWVFVINAPIAMLGLIAVLALLPESRAPAKPDLDPLGMVTSAVGLAAVSYGLIRAGDDGWGNALATMFTVGGVALLLGFFVWERCLSGRARRQPLLDLSLFRSRPFTWGTVLAFVIILAFMGVLFSLPQYFEDVRGFDSLGSGLRLLPLVGGYMVGALPAAQIVRLFGAKVATAVGFAVLAVGLLIGSGTGVSSGGVFIAVWMVIAGAGLGLAMATVSSVAIVELSAERSGVGSAVFQAVCKMGGPLGTAILGSVISAGYLAHLNLIGLPAGVRPVARQGIADAIVIGQRFGSTTLITSAKVGFSNGLDSSLIVVAAAAIAGLLLALAFLPNTRTPASASGLAHDTEREPSSVTPKSPTAAT